MIPGNHDYAYSGDVFDNYHYIDFSKQKIRAIFLNTADGGSENISVAQLKWFAQVLDLSEKEDADQWGILIFSHHPLDWGNVAHASYILQAYLSGGSCLITHEGTQFTCRFAGKNAAKVIAQFHGHTHCLKVDNLCYVTNSVAKPTKVQRIAIPNACFYRNNHYGGSDLSEYYGIEFGEDITYNKTAGTVKDTAFCVVSIDLDQNIIYAYCYGAGYDRIIQY